VVSDNQGQFKFVDVPVRRYFSLRMRGPGNGSKYEPDTARFVRGGDRNLRLVRRRTADENGRLTATLVAADSGVEQQCVAAALLRSESVSNGPIKTGMVNLAPENIYLHNSEVVVDDIPVGEWCLWVLAPSGRVGVEPVTISSDQRDIHCTVSTCAGTSLTVTLVLSDLVHVAMERTQISATRRGFSRIPYGEVWSHAAIQTKAWGRGSPSGECMLKNLVPGIYDINVSGDGLVGTAEIDLQSGGNRSIIMQAHKEATVRLYTEQFVANTQLLIRVKENNNPWQEFAIQPAANDRTEHMIEVTNGLVAVQVFQLSAQSANADAILLSERRWDLDRGGEAELVVSPKR
jgi:hypothetical protein